MKCRIAHWQGKQPPIPEAIKVTDPDAASDQPTKWEIEVDDLFEFVEKHGMIQLRKLKDGGWLIFVTDHGFRQS